MPLDPTLNELFSSQSQDPSPAPPTQGLPPAQPTPYWYGRDVQQQQQWGGLGSGLSDIAGQTGNAAFGAWKNISEPIWNAMTTPPGETPSDLEQQARTAADLGYQLTTGGMGLGTKFAEQGALGIMGAGKGFGKYAARTGDTSMIDLNMAKQMEAQGMTREQILGAKDWYKEGPSGIWNKEIFDYPSDLNTLEVPFAKEYLPHISTVGKTLKHDELYKVYPHLKDMPLLFKDDPVAFRRAQYARFGLPVSPEAPHGFIVLNNPHITAWPNIKTSLLHELQHAVDLYEGRPMRVSKDFLNPDGSVNFEKYFMALEEGRARNTEWRSNYPADVLREPGMAPWKTMEKMHNPYREEQFTLPP